MRKRLLSFLLSALSFCAVWAQETTTAGGVVYELSAAEQTARVVGLEDTGATEAVIPQTITSGGQNYAVTAIGAEAFRGLKTLEDVSLPEGLRVIEGFAFSGCTNLYELFLPATLDSIGESAFSNMNGSHRFFFRSEKAPAVGGNPFVSQDYSLETKGYIYAFTRASDPFQTEFEGFDRFLSDEYYMTCRPWSGIDEAHGFIFAVNEAEQTACVVRTYDGRDDVVIPASVDFEGRQYRVTSIYHTAYSEGPQFFQSWSLRSLSLPPTLEVIGYAAFAMNYALTTVTLPDGLRFVGDYAFDGCLIGEDYQTSIEPQGSIHIPASVDSIGYNAFYAKHITVDAANKHYDSRNNCDGVIRTADNTLVLTGSAFSEIPASVEGIGRLLFRGSNMSQISLPAGLKRIEDYAFSQCKRLQSISLPEGLQSVGTFAFAACDSLRALRIPAAVNRIDYGAFSGCRLLSVIEVDAANTVFDSREQCNAVIRTADNTLILGALIPNAEREEGQVRFDADTLVIPAGVERIERYAYGFAPSGYSPRVEYSTAKAYKSDPWYGMVVLPQSLKSVGSGAFNGLFFVSDVAMLGDGMELYDTLPDYGRASLSELPFLGMRLYLRADTKARYDAGDAETLSLVSGLASSSNVFPFSRLVVDGRFSIEPADMTAEVYKGWADAEGECRVPESIDVWGLHLTMTGIAANAFQRNTDVKAVFLPAGVTSIGDGAFVSSSLERIEGTENVTSVGWRAFDSTPWLQVAPAEGGVVYVGHSAYTYDKVGETPTSITLREGTTQVAREAFKDLNFTELTLPASVESIGQNSINSTVTTIRSYIREPFELPRQRWRSSQLRNNEITCYVPHGTLEAYQALSIWNQLVLVEMEPDGVTAAKTASVGTDTYYSPDGLRRSVPVKGINIRRTADGSVHKVLQR